MRKVVQIAALPETKNHYAALLAVCDDGSVFRFSAKQLKWERLPDIPQDPAPAESPAEIPLKGETGPVMPYNPKAYNVV